MIYGYARCSTNETKQDIDRQVRTLQDAGAEKIYLEYEHGDAVIKHSLQALLDIAEEGDTLLTTEVSRLSRSTKQLCALLDTIREKRLRLHILGSITVDCTAGVMDPMTAAFLQIAGVFSELELAITRQRVRSGLANARAKGKRLGRPLTTIEDIPPGFRKHYPLYLKRKITVTELARLCDMSRTTVYKYIRLLGDAP